MSGPTILTQRTMPPREPVCAGRMLSHARSRRVGFSVPGLPVYAAWARRRMAGLLAEAWGEGSDVADATQVVAELFNNGCLHGGGRIRARARISRYSMTLRVTTPAPWKETADGREPGERETGRGLEIARFFAESLRIAPDPHGLGTCVTVVCRSAHAHRQGGE